MSSVKDLREALQDVVAPNLKAVVRGLNDLRTELRDGNTLLRSEIAGVEKRTAERIQESEKRTEERIARVYDAIKIAGLTRRYEEVLHKNQQLKKPQSEQQQ